MKPKALLLLALDVLRGTVIGLGLCFALASLWGSEATIVFRYIGY